MPKHMQDIVPARRKRRMPTQEVVLAPRPEVRIPREPRKKSRIWMAVVLVLLGLAFAVIPFFSRATVIVTPKSEAIDLTNVPFTALRRAPQGTLPFEIMALDGDERIPVETATEKQIALRAKGTVVLYNGYSSASQRLAKETRLEGTNGRIYRIQQAVTVPGKDGETPGSVEVGIAADEAGEEYNSPPMDFTIPGFEGTDKEDGFYARSKGDVSGGAEGVTYELSEADRQRLDAEVLPALRSRLENQARVQIPSGYVLYAGATVFRPHGELETADEGQAVVQKATLYAFLFEEKRLASAIARKEQYPSEDVRVTGVRELVFALKNQAIQSPTEVEELEFTLTGTGKIVENVDLEDLKKDLRGRRERDIQLVVENHSAVESIEASFRPFWRRVFPEAVEDIKAVLVAEQRLTY